MDTLHRGINVVLVASVITLALGFVANVNAATVQEKLFTKAPVVYAKTVVYTNKVVHKKPVVRTTRPVVRTKVITH
jgi:hypothetical protein